MSTAKFGRTLRDATAIYHDDIAIPANTSANGSSVKTFVNGSMGGIAIRTEVTTAGAIASTKVLTLTYQDSADNSSWATIGTVTKTAGALALNSLIDEFILPRDVREYTRVQIATDDATASGKVDIFANMVV